MAIIFQSLIHCHSKRQSKANVEKKSFQLRQKRKRPPIPGMVIDPWTDRGILDFHKRDRLLFAPTNQTLSRLISIKNEPKLFSKWQLATVRPNSHTLMNFSWPVVVEATLVASQLGHPGSTLGNALRPVAELVQGRGT